MKIEQQVVDESRIPQNQHPGIGADQITCPEGKYHQKNKNGAPSFGGPSDPVGHRIPDNKKDYRCQKGDAKGTQ